MTEIRKPEPLPDVAFRAAAMAVARLALAAAAAGLLFVAFVAPIRAAETPAADGATPLSSRYLEERLAAERRLRRDGSLSPEDWRDLLHPERADRLRRFHVISAAGEQATPEVLRALQAFASDRDPTVRGAAADAAVRVARTIGADVGVALGSFDASESAAALRRVVLADLSALQSGARPAGLHHDRDYRDLAALGPAAIEPLLRVARDRAFKPDSRAAAVAALARVGEGRVAGAIGSFLGKNAKEAPEEIRIAAAASLCHLGRFSKDVEAALLAGTRDFNASVRNYANWGLVTLPDLAKDEDARRAVAPALVDQLRHEYDEGVISILSFGAMAVRDDAILEALLDAYDKAYGYAPFYVLEAIAAYAADRPKAAAALEAATASEIPAVRILAERSLGRTPSEATVLAAESQAVRGLPQFDDEAGLAVKTAVRALGMAGGESAYRILREKARDLDDGIRSEALLSLGVGGYAAAADLLEDAAAFDRYEYARYFACLSLRLLRDPRCLPFAIDLLDCGNFWVHGEAARLVEESTGKRFGYDPRAERPERRRVQREIEEWWGASFERLSVDPETGLFEAR